jgi:hypothetical protein
MGVFGAICSTAAGWVITVLSSVSCIFSCFAPHDLQNKSSSDMAFPHFGQYDIF